MKVHQKIKKEDISKNTKRSRFRRELFDEKGHGVKLMAFAEGNSKKSDEEAALKSNTKNN